MFWKHIASWSEGKWEWEGKERGGEGKNGTITATVGFICCF